MVRITVEPIRPESIYQLIGKDSSGSVMLHYAVVKPQQSAGGTTSYIEFGTDGDAEGEMQAITADIAAKLAVEDVLLIRRVGRVELGDIISLVAASSPNSEDAFEACRLGIASLKKMRTMVKNEVCE